MSIRYPTLGPCEKSASHELTHIVGLLWGVTRCLRALPLVAIAVLLVASLVGSSDAQVLSAAKRSSDTLSRKLIWATSGVELSDGSGVLVVDAGENQVMRINQDGWVFEALAATKEERSGLKKIHAVADGEGYLLLRHDVDGRPEIRLFEESDSGSGVELVYSGEAIKVGAQVEAIYDFIALRNGLVIFADAYVDDEGVTGLFYVEFRSGGEINLIKVQNPVTGEDLWSGTDDPALHNYIKDDTRQYLTSVGGTGFFLALAEMPWLGRIDVDNFHVELVSYVPDSHAYFPQVAEGQAWKEAQQRNRGFGGVNLTRVFFEVIESVPHMVAGVYPGRSGAGQTEASLNLLVRSRSQASGNEAEWAMIELGAISGREFARVQLPTRAAHLIVIPGESAWTLVEKDALEPINIGFGESAPHLRTDSVTRLSLPAVPRRLGGESVAKLVSKH